LSVTSIKRTTMNPAAERGADAPATVRCLSENYFRVGRYWQRQILQNIWKRQVRATAACRYPQERCDSAPTNRGPLNLLKMPQGGTDKTDKTGSVSFVSSYIARVRKIASGFFPKSSA
jgi:hypothetical protein